MNPSPPTNSQDKYPILVRVGLGMAAIAMGFTALLENELLKDIFLGLFAVGTLLLAVGGIQVIIQNEKVNSSTLDAKLRRLYLYVIAIIVITLLCLAAIAYFYNPIDGTV